MKISKLMSVSIRIEDNNKSICKRECDHLEYNHFIIKCKLYGKLEYECGFGVKRCEACIKEFGEIK